MTKVIVTRGITYSPPGAVTRQLDLYVPVGFDRTPVIIYLHGGGWIVGGRDDSAGRFLTLAEQGVAVASIDYTLAQSGPYPAQVEDIVAAGNWLAAAGAEWGLDTRSFAVAGASAGAHLALLAAMDMTREVSAHPWTIFAAIGYFGNYDLTSMRPLSDPALAGTIPTLAIDQEVLAQLGGEFPLPAVRQALIAGVDKQQLTDEVLARISPAHQVHSGTPPLLLIHGSADAVAPLDQSRLMLERAHNVGVAAELSVIDGANHEGAEFDTRSVAATIARFLQRARNQSLVSSIETEVDRT